MTGAEIIAKFNVKQIPPTDGGRMVSRGEFLWFILEDELFDSGWRSTIKDKLDGEEVARTTLFRSVSGKEQLVWLVHSFAPDWMKPLDEYTKLNEDLSVMMSEELERIACYEADKLELEEVRSRYRGTNIAKFLESRGRGHLVYLVQ